LLQRSREALLRRFAKGERARYCAHLKGQPQRDFEIDELTWLQTDVE